MECQSCAGRLISEAAIRLRVDQLEDLIKKATQLLAHFRLELDKLPDISLDSNPLGGNPPDDQLLVPPDDSTPGQGLPIDHLSNNETQASGRLNKTNQEEQFYCPHPDCIKLEKNPHKRLFNLERHWLGYHFKDKAPEAVDDRERARRSQKELRGLLGSSAVDRKRKRRASSDKPNAGTLPAVSGYGGSSNPLEALTKGPTSARILSSYRHDLAHSPSSILPQPCKTSQCFQNSTNFHPKRAPFASNLTMDGEAETSSISNFPPAHMTSQYFNPKRAPFASSLTIDGEIDPPSESIFQPVPLTSQHFNPKRAPFASSLTMDGETETPSASISQPAYLLGPFFDQAPFDLGLTTDGDTDTSFDLYPTNSSRLRQDATISPYMVSGIQNAEGQSLARGLPTQEWV